LERLRYIREQAGYSQQDLADESGVSQHTISEIELGRRKPQGRTLRKLAKVLNVEVADLYGESAYPKGEAPPDLQQSFNGLLEEERRVSVIESCFGLADKQISHYEQRLLEAEHGGFFVEGQGARTLFDEVDEVLVPLGTFLSRDLIVAAFGGREGPIPELVLHQLETTLDRLARVFEQAAAKAKALAETEAEKEAIRRRSEIYAQNIGRLSA